MREIKFRGMDIVNNKWLYGNLEIPLINQSKSKHFIVGHFYGQYQKLEVNPKTIGQYTGLKDKDGKGIYEGDIVECFNDGNSYVSFKGGAYGLIFDYSFIPFSDVYGEMKVIGNIYEHPHLLKEGEK